MSKTKNKKTEQNSALGYIGNVEVSLVRGKKVIKTVKVNNSGKLALFSFLSNALIGRFQPGGVPRYIMLGFGSPESAAIQVSTNAIPYSTVSLAESASEGDTFSSAVFKFLIPFASIPTGVPINVIRLFSQESFTWESRIAYFTLPNNIVSDGKSNILVTWTMKVTNQI